MVLAIARRSRFLSTFTMCHLSMHRLAASRTPRYHLLPPFAVVAHITVSTPIANGELPVDPSVA